jgi:hypothetical protein
MTNEQVLNLANALAVAPTPVPEDQVVSLTRVLAEVQSAVDEYHSTGAVGLPPVSQIQVDFKTTYAVTIGVALNFLIFKFGVSVKRDNLHDISFTYNYPTPPKTAALTSPAPDLKSGLAMAIQEAAKAKVDAELQGTAPKGITPQVAVTLQFTVTWDGTAGASVPISLVTIGPNLDVSKASVHSARVVFGK